MNLLTKKVTAKRADISVRTLDRLFAMQEGPTVTRIGRRIRVREDHFQEWIERCQVRDQPSA